MRAQAGWSERPTSARRRQGMIGGRARASRHALPYLVPPTAILVLACHILRCRPRASGDLVNTGLADVPRYRNKCLGILGPRFRGDDAVREERALDTQLEVRANSLRQIEISHPVVRGRTEPHASLIVEEEVAHAVLRARQRILGHLA